MLAVGLLVALSGGPRSTPRSPIDGAPVDSLPEARDVLSSIGRRLSRTMSAAEITEAAAKGERLLGLLSRQERSALARDLIRFRVDRRTVVQVAAPAESIPFWLADEGFRPTGERLLTSDGPYRLFRKTYEAGPIGLGVNALDASPARHYAVFLGGADGKGEPVVSGLDEDRFRLVPPFPWSGPSWDDSRPFEGLPPSVSGSLLIQARKADRAATALVVGKAWKTHSAATPNPDQVVVSFGADPARTLSFSWRTAADRQARALRFAPAAPDRDEPANPASVQRVEARMKTIETRSVVNDPIETRHFVRLDDLSPSTDYVYKLDDDGPAPWRRVRTAPDRGRDVSFLYMGDPQCGLEEWGKLLKAARSQRPDASFLLIAGDLVDRGAERTNWDHFFLRAAGVFDVLPLMPAIGNHEYLDGGPRLYRSFFDPPANGPEGVDVGLAYHFEAGDAVIAVLDSNLGIASRAGADRQAAWLDRVYSESKATWKLAVFHHPLYTSHPDRPTPYLKESWGPIFDKHRVALVLQGHDHAYLRTHPMRADRRVAEGQGTYYVVSVSGTKYVPQAPRSYTAVGRTDLSTYQTIDIDAKARRLVYRALDIDGKEIDRLVLDRSGDGKPGSEESQPGSTRRRPVTRLGMSGRLGYDGLEERGDAPPLAAKAPKSPGHARPATPPPRHRRPPR